MTPSDKALKILAKAEDTLRSAEHDLKGGFILATANRAYYSCFYCMTALLDTQGIYSKTHQGTHAKFSELFIKTGIFPVDISDSISVLFEYRQEADYDLEADIDEEDAKKLISKASEFFQMTKNYFDHLDADTKSSSQ